MGNNHASCYGGHCCILHGCKYNHDDCPIVTEKEVQEGGCEECGLIHSGYFDPEPEYDDAPYGCPRCGSTRIIFSSAYDIPEGEPPTYASPIRYFVLCLSCKHEGQWAEFKGHKSKEIRRAVMPNPFNMGHLIEGTIEQDPMTDRWNIRTVDAEGQPRTFDVQEAMAALKGKEVRLTLVSLENLARLAELVENAGGGGQVLGVHPEDIGVPFDTGKKS